MMAPFEGSSSQQTSQGNGGVKSLTPRPPSLAQPSPNIQNPHHNGPPFGHPGMRQQSSGMGPPSGGGGSFNTPSQSPSGSGRQSSFSNMSSNGGGGGGGDGHHSSSSQSSFPSLNSPAHAQQQQHSSSMRPQQMQRSHGSYQQHHSLAIPSRESGQKHSPMGSAGVPVSDSRHQQQQQYMNTGLNGNWQSDKDMPHRREMIQHIVKMLKKDKSGSPEWLSKLPQMAKQLEVSLYRNARSFEAYADMSTLRNRLQQIAMEVSRKAKGGQGGDRDRSVDRQPQQPQSSMFPNGMRNQHHPPSSMSSQGQGPHQQRSSQDSSVNQRGSQVVQMNDINPMAGVNGSSGVSSSLMQRQSSGTTGYNNSRGSSAPSPSAMNQQNRNDPEWKTRIRHKQQRLLLLHHSAKCPHEDGRCTITPHCADMKRLWRHMEGCKDNNCRVPHCFSSRAILSHYRKCKERSCPACGPVRETVRKGQSRLPPEPAQQQRGGNHQSGPGGPMGMNAMGNNRNFSGDNRGMSSNPSQQHPVTMASDPMNSGPGGNSLNQSSIPNKSFQQPTPRQQSISRPSMNGSGGNNYDSSLPSMHPPSRSSGSGFNSEVDVFQSSRPNTVSEITLPPEPSSNGAGGSSNRHRRQGDSEWQKVRHKQQRLLLLRHASKCQYENGKCPVTPHCASMKKLWEHIAHCKNSQCTVTHCMSSRYVLSHYRRCKDTRCPACGPVRETIRKSHEKERKKIPNGSMSQFDDQQAMSGNMGSGNMGLRPMSNQSGSIMSSCMPPTGSNDEIPYRSPVKKTKMEDSISMPNSISSPNDKISLCAPASNSSSTSQMPTTNVNIAKKETKASTAKQAQKSKKGDHQLINTFTVAQIERHIASLDRTVQLSPQKLKQKCLEVLKGLQTHQHGWVFNTPVDPVELGLPDYFVIIKKPMDLGTVNKKLDNSVYHAIEDFQRDVNLTFDNAMTYNEENSVVHDMAKELKAKFKVDFEKLVMQLETEDRERRQNDRACTLCGCEKLLFEPPVYFCNGMNCTSTRIRRNSHFYIAGNNQYFWCSTCYNELDDKIPIELVDMTIMKDVLKKKKNDEVHEESWVECDTCKRWVHQICGLFNARQNTEHQSEYCCPKCLLEKRKSSRVRKPQEKPPCAADLPRTKLSEWLERHIQHKSSERRRALAEEKAEVEKISVEEAMKTINQGGNIIIRQVTSTDRKLDVRDGMKKRYEHKEYPDEFPFRCKCILVFQNLDGVDVVLFALYIYEHGEDNPPPNKRAVYISYLDSVHFMRPRKLRTFVYHEILISYLEYARQRGFATAHIWACPPLKGDDYIFYAKPEDQKTPKDNRLRQWYIDMLIECQKRSIAGEVTNMYDLYFANKSLDATAVPYLEGDYFPGEAENIIKELEEGGGKKGKGIGNKKKKKQSKSKSRGAEDGNSDNSTKPFEEGGRDQVMVKLGETIKPMKESFIVAFLNWDGADPAHLEVPEDIKKHREELAAKKSDSSKKRNASGELCAVALKAVRELDDLKDETGKPLKLLDDDDEDMDCEFFNNRQAFLNLCRGNHYQFDEMRRAKHTSMMVLWHLHNRDAPKFVQQCAACLRDILQGTRYHCDICTEYDLCEECYKNRNTNRGVCAHELKPISVEADSSGGDAEGPGSELSAAEREARQRNLHLHIQLIEHASRCNSKSCTSSNCAKMKSYLQHGRQCKIRASGGCKICKRIWTLLRIHAQKCKDRLCPIPQCMAIRERIRQLAKQQQAMDDRRRHEMNRHYRMGLAAG